MSYVSELVRACKIYGFALSAKHTMSRFVGDGILQQIYYGDTDQVCIGLTSMYANLPDIFWKSKIPFTSYSARHFHNRRAPRFAHEFNKADDISALLEGGLATLDSIRTQEQLVRFALSIDSLEMRPLHAHSERLWGAYWISGMKKELMYEVCYAYTQKCEGFHRQRTNIELIENNRFNEFVPKLIAFADELSELSELWHALLLEDQAFMCRYVSDNLSQNLEQITKLGIPILQ